MPIVQAKTTVCRGIAIGDCIDFGSRQRPTSRTISSQVSARNAVCKFRPTAAMVARETLRRCAPISTIRLAMPVQQRQIAANVRLHVQAGDLGAEQQTAHVAGHAEIDQPGFVDRIDRQSPGRRGDGLSSGCVISRG